MGKVCAALLGCENAQAVGWHAWAHGQTKGDQRHTTLFAKMAPFSAPPAALHSQDTNKQV